MGADAPMLRSRRHGTRICHHPWCGAGDDERPMRERYDDAVEISRDIDTGLDDAYHESGRTA